MSESELIEAAGIYYALSGDMLSLYLTATTGFLIAAYLIGDKLTRFQLITVSSLYLVFAIATSYLVVGYGVRGISYTWALAEVNPNTQIGATYVVPAALGFVLLSGIFACLIFMWQVRHPKTE